MLRIVTACFMVLLSQQAASNVVHSSTGVEVGADGMPDATASSSGQLAEDQDRVLTLPVQGHGELILNSGDDPCMAIEVRGRQLFIRRLHTSFATAGLSTAANYSHLLS